MEAPLPSCRLKFGFSPQETRPRLARARLYRKKVTRHHLANAFFSTFHYDSAPGPLVELLNKTFWLWRSKAPEQKRLCGFVSRSFRCPKQCDHTPLFPPLHFVDPSRKPRILLQCQALSGISVSRRMAWPKLLMLSPRRLYLVICAFSASPLNVLPTLKLCSCVRVSRFGVEYGG